MSNKNMNEILEGLHKTEEINEAKTLKPTGDPKEDLNREIEGADYAVYFEEHSGEYWRPGVIDLHDTKKDGNGYSLAHGQLGNHEIYLRSGRKGLSNIYIVTKKSFNDAEQAVNAKGFETIDKNSREFEKELQKRALRIIDKEYLKKKDAAHKKWWDKNKEEKVEESQRKKIKANEEVLDEMPGKVGRPPLSPAERKRRELERLRKSKISPKQKLEQERAEKYKKEREGKAQFEKRQREAKAAEWRKSHTFNH